MLDASTTTSSSSASTTSFSSFSSATLASLEKCTAVAPELTPKLNRPVRMPKAVDAWHRLKRIEHIDVVPVEGATSVNETVYTINVYMRRSQSRIPTTYQRMTETSSLLGSPSSLGSLGSPRGDAIPDFQVTRSFADLDTLRHNVWTAIRQYHPVYCGLFDGLAVQLLTKHSTSPVLNATIHRSPAKRAKKMHKLVTYLLSELHEKKAACVARCKGQHELPMLLQEFLCGTDDVSVTSL